MSFSEGGPEILVPTIAENGRQMTEDEAIAQYQKTGKHLGKFKTVNHANAYADKLHRQQAGELSTPVAKPSSDWSVVPDKTDAQYARAFPADPSPSGPIYGQEVSGEPLSEKDAHRQASEQANNPVKDDWIAQAVLSQAATGPIVGPALGAVSRGIVGAGKAVARSPGLVKAGVTGAVKAALPHSAVLSAVKGGIKAIQEAKAAGSVAKAATEAAPIAEEAAASIPITTPPKLAPLVAETPAGKMYDTLQKALKGATAEQAVTIKAAMAGLEAKAAKQAVAVPRWKAPEYAPTAFDEVGSGPTITPAERTAFQGELKTAHGEIPGLTDAPVGGAETATSEGATVTGKPPGKTAIDYEVSPNSMKASPDDFDHVVKATAKGGQEIGSATARFNPDGQTMSSGDTFVEPGFRRQGVATKMYEALERETGRKMVPAPAAEQTAEGKLFSRSRQGKSDMRVPEGVIVGEHPLRPGWSKLGPGPAESKAFGTAEQWTPGRADYKFAKQLGVPVEKYRAIMEARVKSQQ